MNTLKKLQKQYDETEFNTVKLCDIANKNEGLGYTNGRDMLFNVKMFDGYGQAIHTQGYLAGLKYAMNLLVKSIPRKLASESQ